VCPLCKLSLEPVTALGSIYPLPPGTLRVRRNPSISPTADGGFWVVEGNHSSFARYDGSGELVVQLDVDRPWFTPWDEVPPGNGTERPHVPVTHALRELGDGRALPATTVPILDWVPRARTGGLRTEPTNGVIDTPLELIDLDTGTVLGSVRAPWDLRFVAGPGEPLVHAPESMPSLDESIHIWRVSIEPEGP
jgi:hypothetical protein